MVYTIKPSDLLFEEGGKIGLPAKCCLAFSGDEPAGDHEPSGKESSDTEVDKLFQDLKCGLDYLIIGHVEDISEVSPTKDEEGRGGTQSQCSHSSECHQNVVGLICESEQA